MSHELGAPIVVIEGIEKRFGALVVLRDISLTVRRGECVCVIGPSGSGKSTLLRAINALVPVSKGSIKVDGIEVNDLELDKLALRRKVGIVFQQYNLFPHKTALENVMMAPLHVLKQQKDEVEARARRLLAKVRLSRQGGRLSGRAVGRPAATRRHRPVAGDEPNADAV